MKTPNANFHFQRLKYKKMKGMADSQSRAAFHFLSRDLMTHAVSVNFP